MIYTRSIRNLLNQPSNTNTFYHPYQGYSLVELLVVISIIGILSSLAIPGYQNYMAKAQMTTALDFAVSHRVAIEDSIYEIGAFPQGDSGLLQVFGELVTKVQKEGDTEQSITFEHLAYIQKLTLTADKNNQDQGTLVIEIDADTENQLGINQKIRGKTLTFTRTNANWACTTNAPKKVTPRNCDSTA